MRIEVNINGNITEHEDAPVTPITLEQAKASKLAEVTMEYNNAIYSLVGTIDQYELASWAKQEEEARAYVEDNTVATPLLSGMVASRGLGETVLEFAHKIIAKSNAYQVAYAVVLGTYQAKQKTIDAATTVEEVQAIDSKI
jgi:cystathionine beta-lyase/cystathionine gamma-synthase